MNYLLMIYGDQTAWEAMSQSERDEVLRLHAELVDGLRESGELICGAGLAKPEQTTTVQTGDGRTTGPLAAAGKQMSAFYLVDYDIPERAETLAGGILDPHVSAVEVRPVHTVER